MKEQIIFVVFIYCYYVNYDNCGTVVAAFENTYEVAGYSEVQLRWITTQFCSKCPLRIRDLGLVKTSGQHAIYKLA